MQLRPFSAITSFEIFRCKQWAAQRRVCRYTLAGLLSFTLSMALSAQETDAAAEADPEATKLYKLLFVEMPVPFAPELDAVLPEIPVAIDLEDDPQFITRRNAITDYQATVEGIELNGGTWDRSLIEELSALAALQQQQGNHVEAIQLFDRAIHVNRIHSGLHTLEQIPTVENMIESHLALGDWDQADIYNDYLFFIQQRAYGPNDPRLIPVLDRLASWNIQAFNIGHGEALGLRLSTAQILLNAAAKMVAVHFGEDDERFVSYRRNLANSAYLISTNPDVMAASQELDYRNAADILISKLESTSAQGPSGFRAGETALREIVQHFAKQENAPYELASALADLGDWYLIFQQRRAAEELYAEAWQVLERSDNAEAWIQQLFGQVIPIPTFANSVENLLTPSIVTSNGNSVHFDYADVVFDVAVSGDARNLEVLTEETPSNMGHLSRLQREIRNSYFRPRVENGELQQSDRNYFRYRYWY